MSKLIYRLNFVICACGLFGLHVTLRGMLVKCGEITMQPYNKVMLLCGHLRNELWFTSVRTKRIEVKAVIFKYFVYFCIFVF